MSRPRAATVAECQRDIPKAPSRRPTLAPSSPPELLLPPLDPEFISSRQTRSYSVGILEQGLQPHDEPKTVEEFELEESASPLPTNPADDFFMLCEQGMARSSPRPTLLELSSRDYVPENPDFPGSPILRNCLEQIQRMSFRLDPSSPSSPANG